MLETIATPNLKNDWFGNFSYIFDKINFAAPSAKSLKVNSNLSKLDQARHMSIMLMALVLVISIVAAIIARLKNEQ